MSEGVAPSSLNGAVRLRAARGRSASSLARRGALAALLSSCLLLGATAQAGNEEGVLFGATAGMTAGAVTAITDDGSSLWYNPAGLAGADTQQLDISGTAYVLRLSSAPDLLRVSGQTSVAGNITELMSVSASLTYARRLSDHLTLGFGIFTPRSSDQTLRATARVPGDVNWLLTSTDVAGEVDAGVGLGWSPSPRLRFGASLFFVYESYSGAFIGQVTQGPGPAPDQFANYAELYSFKRAGVELLLGMQWRPVDSLRIGVSVRPPGANVYASESADSSESAAVRDAMGALQGAAMSTVTDSSSFEFTQRTPLRVRVGVAVERPRFTLALDGDLATPFTPSDRDDRAWSLHWNLRLGGIVRVSERLRLGAGFFTDRSPSREAQNHPVDFYGGTVGVEWGTLHLLRAERRDRLTFSTSITARYAYGSGTTGAIQTVASSIDAVDAVSTLDVHELAIYLGSTFSF